MDYEYTIGGVSYRLLPLSWQQNKWLADYIFKDIDMHRLQYGVVHDLLRDKGALFMAICLVDVGMSRSEHSRLAWKDIAGRAETFAAELTGEEVARFGPHFFSLCLGSPMQMAMLMPGKVMQLEMERAAEQGPPSAAPGATGSSAASSASAEATSPSSPSSLPIGDQATVSPISSDASSGRPSTEPS